MNRKVLFVDDAPNLLELYAGTVGKQFEVETALTGEDALQTLHSKGPFAVIVADRQMPRMDGIELLARVTERFPDTIQIMLTGAAELESTIAAVNQTHLFRFLNKPAHTPTLRQALEDAVRQYQLVLAERELLEKTLTGSIEVLMDLLSMIDPDSFARANELRMRIPPIARALGLKNVWELEIAAQFSQISYLTIPRELVQRSLAGAALNQREQEVIMRLPAIARKLVSHIPRLEGVAEILYYERANFDGSGFPADNRAGQAIPIGARLLRAVSDCLDLENQGEETLNAIHIMATRRGQYDPAILAILAREMKQSMLTPRIVNISAQHLQVGHILHSDIETKDGLLLLNRGRIITPATLEKIQNFLHLTGIKEPIAVRLKEEETVEEASDSTQ
jgi:response regulator RpfG family c-di-GMP phosphodiesterase